MQVYIFVLVTFAIFAIGSCGNNNSKITCIHGKIESDMGSSYTTCHQRSGALPIPRIKQCFQDAMKAEQVVKVANNGQMTIDGTKFSQYASSRGNTNVGKAMGVCARRSNAADMYKEAARAIQCVFDEVKKTCK